MPISPVAEKYAWPDLSWQQDGGWQYLPDAVTDALFAAAKPNMQRVFETHLALQEKLPPLNTHRLLIPDPQLTLEQSFEIVARAFESFDPRLGAKARELIANPSRWKLGHTEPGDAWGHNDDGPDKNKDRAIIEYFHDGTINDPVYIAHELGHLMASDFASDTGLRPQEAFRTSAWHLNETQGFFGQYILYDYLMSGREGDALKKAAAAHFTGEVTRGLYEWPAIDSYIKHYIRHEAADPVAGAKDWLGPRSGEFTKLDRLNPLNADKELIAKLEAPETRHYMHHSLNGGHATGAVLGAGLFHVAKQNTAAREKIIDALMIDVSEQRRILKVLSVAGVETNDALKAFASNAIADMTAPLLAMATPKPALKSRTGMKP